MAAAAAACGADGLLIEVHNNPAAALCDGAQSLTPEEFAETAALVRAVRGAVSSVGAHDAPLTEAACDRSACRTCAAS